MRTEPDPNYIYETKNTRLGWYKAPPCPELRALFELTGADTVTFQKGHNDPVHWRRRKIVVEPVKSTAEAKLDKIKEILDEH